MVVLKDQLGFPCAQQLKLSRVYRPSDLSRLEVEPLTTLKEHTCDTQIVSEISVDVSKIAVICNRNPGVTWNGYVQPIWVTGANALALSALVDPFVTRTSRQLEILVLYLNHINDDS